jgi:hypothetical protein
VCSLYYIQDFRKVQQGLRWNDTEISKEVPVNTSLESSACWDMSSRCSLWCPCISTQLSAPRNTEVKILSKNPVLIRIPWHAFPTRCCNTSKSLIGAEHTKVFRCHHSQKSKGLRSRGSCGPVIGSPHPTHCSPKVWFRCCQVMRRKWGGAPSCMSHMCCRWIRDEEANVPK